MPLPALLSTFVLPRSSSETLVSLRKKLRPRSLLMPLLQLLIDPLSGFVVLSIVFFLPAILSFRVDENSFVIESNLAASLQIAFACSLSVTAPLFVDLLLDFIGMRETPFLGHRLLSTLVLACGNGVILCYSGTSKFELVLITCFLWSYFLEFIIILSTLHALSDLSHWRISSIRRFITQLALFVFFFCSLLCETDEGDGYITESLAIAGFVVFSVMIFIKTFLLFRMHYLAYKSSNMTVWEWYTSVEERILIVQIRCAGLCSQIIIIYIIFFALNTPYRGFDGLFHVDDIFKLVIIRTFFFVFEYFISSRIFRIQLIRNNQGLAFKTRLIKYFSHEMRSPIMVMTVGLELIEETLVSLPERHPLIDENLADVKRSCDQSLELLDSLLLYEKIENKSLSLELSSVEPLECLRAMLRTYESAAKSAQLGMFLVYDPAQFISSDKRLAIDTSKVKHVLDPLLISVLRKTIEKSPRESTKFNLLLDAPHPAATLLSNQTLPPNQSIECVVMGPSNELRREHDVTLSVSVNQGMDVGQAILKSHLKMRDEHTSHNLSFLSTWLHVEIIDRHHDINDTDIATMNSRNLDFTREG